ncbi:MAG: glycoside hydrolase family 13 protein, partial [Mogibacterium sp.]|nr:glycoside hydrolase family 13 protein [Mogibacterium sp.]
MKIYHDSHSTEYRTPFGAAETGSEVTLSLDVTDCEPLRVMLGVWQDESGSDSWEEMKKTADGRYTSRIKMPDEGTLLWYAFAVETVKDAGNGERNGCETVYYGNNAERLGGAGSVYDEYPVPYQITVYKESKVPSWYTDGIIYQIFPGRFARDENWEQRCRESAEALAERRSDIKRVVEYDWNREAYYVKNDKGEVVEWPLYGGSLRGIESKLDYLKSLGVTGIYLNPLVCSASNHHYDTYDYMKVDSSLGTNADFEHLAAAAKSRGIRIILDGVFSHTGRDSIYFGKYSADGSGAYNDPESPYRSWYKFDESKPCGYSSWWGIEDLPEVNEEDPGFRELINGREGVIARWMEMGASGWRLDVADELPDSFIREVRERVKDCDPDGLLIGEVWEDASNKISYDERRRYFMGDELDGTMNYPLRTLLLDYINYTTGSARAGRELTSIRENYPEENFYAALNIIGSHDRERIISAMAAAEDRPSAIKKVRLLSTLQFTLPGVPCIYYGDEAGLGGGADPANRSGFPWGNEDPKLEYHYRMLGLIYKEHPVLAAGDLCMLSGRYGISDDIFAFIRKDSSEKILVLANRSYGPADADLSGVTEAGGGFALDLLTSKDIP